MKPMPHRSGRPARGLTMVELMVVVAVIGVLVALAAPSFREMITMQRLRGVNAQLVTDMQFARSEAVARGRVVRVNFGRQTAGTDTDRSCYVIYVSPGNGIRCNCENAGAVCASESAQEIRTVNVLRSSGVSLTWPDNQNSAFGFDPVTGGLVNIPTDQGVTPAVSVKLEARVDDNRRLVTTIVQTGRPTVCAPNAAVMGGASC